MPRDDSERRGDGAFLSQAEVIAKRLTPLELGEAVEVEPWRLPEPSKSTYRGVRRVRIEPDGRIVRVRR